MLAPKPEPNRIAVTKGERKHESKKESKKLADGNYRCDVNCGDCRLAVLSVRDIQEYKWNRGCAGRNTTLVVGHWFWLACLYCRVPVFFSFPALRQK